MIIIINFTHTEPFETQLQGDLQVMQKRNLMQI